MSYIILVAFYLVTASQIVDQPDYILRAFYLVALSQIFLLSYYYPKKILQRWHFVTETYPPSKFPKLYPEFSGEGADEAVKRSPRIYRIVSLCTLLGGLLLLGMAWMSDFPLADEGVEAILVLYFMLQMLPLVIMEIREHKKLKLMKLIRKTNHETRRTAELQPRQFFDFVSPVTFSIAVLMLLAYIAFGLYINDFDVSFGSDMFATIITLAVVHLFYAVLIKIQVFGKKMNPYQANKDRLTQMKVMVTMLVYSSIMMSIFFMVIAAMEEFEVHNILPILMSIFFQAVTVFGTGTILRSTQIETMDFDVYKKDTLET